MQVFVELSQVALAMASLQIVDPGVQLVEDISISVHAVPLLFA